MKTFRLRLWLPTLVLLLTSLIILGMIAFQTSVETEQLKQNSLTRVKQIMGHLQREVEEELTHNHLNKVEQEISVLGTIHEVTKLAFIDDTGTVKYALNYAWKNQTISRVIDDFDINAYQNAVHNQKFKITFQSTQRNILAFYPINLPGNGEYVRSHKIGVLFIEYDLSGPIGRVWQQVLQESALLWLSCLLLMLALFVALTRLVNRPINHLIASMQQFGQTETLVQADLSGKGELAVLGKTFNNLAKTVTDNRTQLIRQKNLYNTLSKTNHLISRIQDEQQLFQGTCNIIVEHGGFMLAAVGLPKTGGINQRIFACAGTTTSFFEQPPSPVLIQTSRTLWDEMTNTDFLVINDYLTNPLTTAWHSFAAEAGIKSCAVIALTHQNQTKAFLQIYADNVDFFTTDIVNLLHSMHDDLCFALHSFHLNEIRQQTEQALREREENLAITLNAIGDAVIATDAQGLISRMNPIAENMTGWTLQEAQGKPLDQVFHIIHAINRTPVKNPVSKVIKNGRIVGLANHTALIAKDGTEHQIADSAAPIRDNNGAIIGVIMVFQNVTEQYRIDAELKKSEERFRHATEVSGAYVWELDLNFHYTYLSEQVHHVKGYSADQLLGHTPFEFMHAADRESNRQLMQQALTNLTSFSLQLRNLTADGKTLWEEVKGQVVLNKQGKAHKIRGAGISINDRLQAEAEIKQLAYFDPLTNLPNRRLVFERIEQDAAAAKRHNYYGAILFIDLDHFKNLNDGLGHDAGDELLIQIAKRLQGQLRREDTAGRLGGDEFIVLLSNVGDTENEAVERVRNVTTKIQQTLLKSYNLNGHIYHLQVSIGITFFPQAHKNARDLLKQADTALYRAKADGRNHFQYFRQEMQVAADTRLQLEKELHQAIKTEQLQLFYQPQLDSSGHIIGAETLLRWPHPTKGFISPADFIPIAEESGLILKLGDWILNSACRQLQQWHQQGVFQSGQTLSINISPKQFRQEDFIGKVNSIINFNHLSAEDIVLEITENLLLRDMEDSIAKMEELKQLGIRFSIDDFGTGYSSLAYLKRLPLSELKIDKTFIDDLNTDSNNLAIIETIIAMAKHMQLSVIAEGVETADQKDLLEKLSCHHFQGYYFSKPLAKEDFETFLISRSQQLNLIHPSLSDSP